MFMIESTFWLHSGHFTHTRLGAVRGSLCVSSLFLSDHSTYAFIQSKWKECPHICSCVISFPIVNASVHIEHIPALCLVFHAFSPVHSRLSSVFLLMIQERKSGCVCVYMLVSFTNGLHAQPSQSSQWSLLCACAGLFTAWDYFI